MPTGACANLEELTLGLHLHRTIKMLGDWACWRRAATSSSTEACARASARSADSFQGPGATRVIARSFMA